MNVEKALQRLNPLQVLGDEMDLFARPFLLQPWRRMGKDLEWAPKMDIFEHNGDLVAKADLPGVKKEDVQVTIEGGDLVVKGERKVETEVKEKDYYRIERSAGEFYRRFALPFEVEPQRIAARFDDGVLEIRIPMPAAKKPEVKKVKVS